MTETLSLDHAFIARDFCVYQWNGEDGLTTAVESAVIAKTTDGRHFLLPPRRPWTDVERFDFGQRYEGEQLFGYAYAYGRRSLDEMVALVNAKGVIRTEFWVEVEEDTRSTEERFNDEYEREQYERMGYGA